MYAPSPIIQAANQCKITWWLRLDRSPPGVTRSPRRLSGVPRRAGAGTGGPDPRDRAWRRGLPRALTNCALGGGEALGLLPAEGAAGSAEELQEACPAAASSRGLPPTWCASWLLAPAPLGPCGLRLECPPEHPDPRAPG
ncbi:hypothetical protein NDU88_005549 [Pleurodeles waltl]|uniref:Uncharacterized protein n=1 Tax=Pleurodeles waltl TaxID=8319 RepID=A0AAV7WY67_PLEWA|nr:hypothetical protein NDU88_005549 [Pleurodeles waltl]